jgi:hypothetical protein
MATFEPELCEEVEEDTPEDPVEPDENVAPRLGGVAMHSKRNNFDLPFP